MHFSCPPYVLPVRPISFSWLLISIWGVIFHFTKTHCVCIRGTNKWTLLSDTNNQSHYEGRCAVFIVVDLQTCSKRCTSFSFAFTTAIVYYAESVTRAETVRVWYADLCRNIRCFSHVDRQYLRPLWMVLIIVQPHTDCWLLWSVAAHDTAHTATQFIVTCCA